MVIHIFTCLLIISVLCLVTLVFPNFFPMKFDSSRISFSNKRMKLDSNMGQERIHIKRAWFEARIVHEMTATWKFSGACDIEVSNCILVVDIHISKTVAVAFEWELNWIEVEETRKNMSMAASLHRLHSPFLCCPLKLSSHSASSFSIKSSRIQRSPGSYPCIRAIDLDQNTIVAISVGVASVAIGIGIPVFYETQIDNAAKRDNTQPCFPCDGSGAQRCRFCLGSGNITLELGGDEKEVSKCINCDGLGSLTCTTCQGTGIQPRYLDRREFKDDD